MRTHKSPSHVRFRANRTSSRYRIVQCQLGSRSVIRHTLPHREREHGCATQQNSPQLEGRAAPIRAVMVGTTTWYDQTRGTGQHGKRKWRKGGRRRNAYPQQPANYTGQRIVCPIASMFVSGRWLRGPRNKDALLNSPHRTKMMSEFSDLTFQSVRGHTICRTTPCCDMIFILSAGH